MGLFKVLAFLLILLSCGGASAQTQVEYLSPLRPEFHVGVDRKDTWVLAEPFRFKVDDKTYEVHIGFSTDFASVPRFVWPIISPYELGVGCIPHDYGYATHDGDKDFWDSVFLICMEKDGIPLWKRQAAYYSVSWFGQHAWDSHTPPEVMYRKKSTEPKAIPDKMSTEANQWKNMVLNLTERK